MKDRFKQFLKDEGVYQEFVNNLRHRERPIGIKAYLNEMAGDEYCYIISAFSWGKEFNKWNTLNKKWEAIWKEE